MQNGRDCAPAAPPPCRRTLIPRGNGGMNGIQPLDPPRLNLAVDGPYPRWVVVAMAGGLLTALAWVTLVIAQPRYLSEAIVAVCLAWLIAILVTFAVRR